MRTFQTVLPSSLIQMNELKLFLNNDLMKKTPLIKQNKLNIQVITDSFQAIASCFLPSPLSLSLFTVLEEIRRKLWKNETSDS